MHRLRFCVPALVLVLTTSCGSTPSVSTTGTSSSVTAFSIPEASGFEGAWLGDLMPGARIQVQLEREGDGTLDGVVDSIDDGLMGVPIDTIVESGDRLQILVGGWEASGDFTLDGDHLMGAISVGGDTFAITLVRLAEPFVLDRPQVPQPPFPYQIEEVTFTNRDAGFDLAGTLTIPAGDGPFPAVVLISGSGPQDRDEQLAGHRPFLVLADHLTRAGIAVLRYDDRGFGASGGTLEGTSEDLATDAAAAFAYLSSRPETGAVGLLGHSEGGLIAPVVANHDPAVTFVVMLAGPGQTGAEVLLEQTRLILEAEGAPGEIVEWQIGLTSAGIAAAASDLSDTALATVMDRIAVEALAGAPASVAGAVTAEGLADVMAPYREPWMRYFLRYDPLPALRALSIPVLALFGEVDLQVPAEANAAAVEAALVERRPGTRVEIVPGVNHLFQHSTTGKISEYAALTETIAPEVLDLVADWILAVATG